MALLMLRRGLSLVLVVLLSGAWVSVPMGCATRQPTAKDRGQSNLANAQQLLAQGLDDQALSAFSAALQENPRLVEAHMGMGDIYRNRGDYPSAETAYTQATKLAPSSYDAHYYLGLVRQLMGKLDESIRDYLRALSIKPDSYEANQNIASAYLQLKRPSEALPYAKRSVDLAPQAQSAWANLGAAYSLLGEYGQAVDAYRQAADLGELSPEILLGLADAHIHLGNYDRALVVLRSLTAQVQNSTAYERMGFVLFKQRQFEEAQGAFRTALQINPDDVSALNGLGVSLMTRYIQSNRVARELHDQAIDSWRRSLTLSPQQPRIIDLLSRYQRL